MENIIGKIQLHTSEVVNNVNNIIKAAEHTLDHANDIYEEQGEDLFVYALKSDIESLETLKTDLSYDGLIKWVEEKYGKEVLSNEEVLETVKSCGSTLNSVKAKVVLDINATIKFLNNTILDFIDEEIEDEEVIEEISMIQKEEEKKVEEKVMRKYVTQMKVRTDKVTHKGFTFRNIEFDIEMENVTESVPANTRDYLCKTFLQNGFVQNMCEGKASDEKVNCGVIDYKESYIDVVEETPVVEETVEEVVEKAHVEKEEPIVEEAEEIAATEEPVVEEEEVVNKEEIKKDLKSRLGRFKDLGRKAKRNKRMKELEERNEEKLKDREEVEENTMIHEETIEDIKEEREDVDMVLAHFELLRKETVEDMYGTKFRNIAGRFDVEVTSDKTFEDLKSLMNEYRSMYQVEIKLTNEIEVRRFLNEETPVSKVTPEEIAKMEEERIAREKAEQQRKLIEEARKLHEERVAKEEDRKAREEAAKQQETVEEELDEETLELINDYKETKRLSDHYDKFGGSIDAVCNTYDRLKMLKEELVERGISLDF